MKDFVIMYQEFAMSLVKLKSNCAKDFLLWRVFNSYDRGDFAFTSLDFERFNGYIETCGGKVYQRNTVDVALKELLDAGFIMRKQRGIYIINPRLIWKGSLELRKITIEIWDKLKEPAEKLA